MERQDLAILFSGGSDSLALYAMAMTNHSTMIPRPRKIHLLHMLNGMARFPDFPARRLDVSRRILEAQIPATDEIPETRLLNLDMGRLFQGLWLDRYEELMPRFNGKNLVCVACKLAMHARAILYCISGYVPLLLAGYTAKQSYFPEQTDAFMDRITDLSRKFGITTAFPVYQEFDSEQVSRHFLEDLGLPSTGGGEQKCLFCQTLTTAGEDDIAAYLDEMIPRVETYIEHRLASRIRDAAEIFPPGRT